MASEEAETNWIDPRYADLVQAWDTLREQRFQRGPVRPCHSCLHGLGTIVMVDAEAKAPIMVPCLSCDPSA